MSTRSSRERSFVVRKGLLRKKQTRQDYRAVGTNAGQAARRFEPVGVRDIDRHHADPALAEVRPIKAVRCICS
jgi:hypothetical protein